MSEYHEPVLLQESVDHLIINPDGIYADLTYGGGGHSAEILSRLSSKGKLVVFDQDRDAESNLIDDPRLVFVRSNFRYLYRFWRWLKLEALHGVLADLGVSSYQFDEKQRGFSYRFESELDMRMNKASRQTASDVLNNYSEAQLQEVFSEYGEVRNSKSLAREIADKRSVGNQPWTSTRLNDLLEQMRIGDKYKYMAQVYQALRIEVNDEMNALKEMLEAGLKVLKPGGRFVIISYHSLEDRLVKRFFKTGNFEGKPVKDEYGKLISSIRMKKNLILPDKEEMKINLRSRSAKMRVAEKI